jgi:ribosomal protein S18 acetylase RimI-like enzyme
MRFVTVASDYRKKGIGKGMTIEFEAETLRRGFSRIYMHARVDALGFYEKMGYKAFGEEFDEATIVHRHVQKFLK